MILDIANQNVQETLKKEELGVRSSGQWVKITSTPGYSTQ
jgi:stress response protein YsnF